MKTTDYFLKVLLFAGRIKSEWIEYALDNPIRTETQAMGAFRFGYEYRKLKNIYG